MSIIYSGIPRLIIPQIKANQINNPSCISRTTFSKIPTYLDPTHTAGVPQTKPNTKIGRERNLGIE